MTALAIDPSEIKITDYRAIRDRLMRGGNVPVAVLNDLTRRERALSVRESLVASREDAIQRECEAVARRERDCAAAKLDLAAREAVVGRREREVASALGRLKRAEARFGARLIEDEPPSPDDSPSFRRFAFNDIVSVVSRRYGVTRTNLLSRRRERSVSDARRAICSLAREFTLMSLPEIGRLLGGRHHTTVMHHAHLSCQTMMALRHALGPEAGLDQWVDALHAAMLQEQA